MADLFVLYIFEARFYYFSTKLKKYTRKILIYNGFWGIM